MEDGAVEVDVEALDVEELDGEGDGAGDEEDGDEGDGEGEDEVGEFDDGDGELE